MCILESISKISEFMRREQSMEKEKGKMSKRKLLNTEIRI